MSNVAAVHFIPVLATPVDYSSCFGPIMWLVKCWTPISCEPHESPKMCLHLTWAIDPENWSIEVVALHLFLLQVSTVLLLRACRATCLEGCLHMGKVLLWSHLTKEALPWVWGRLSCLQLGATEEAKQPATLGLRLTPFSHPCAFSNLAANEEQLSQQWWRRQTRSV